MNHAAQAQPEEVAASFEADMDMLSGRVSLGFRIPEPRGYRQQP